MLPTAPSVTAATATTARPAVTTGAGPRKDRPIPGTGVPDSMKTAAALTGATIPAPSPGTTADPMAAVLTGALETDVRTMLPDAAVAAGRTRRPVCGGPATGTSASMRLSVARRTGVPS